MLTLGVSAACLAGPSTSLVLRGVVARSHSLRIASAGGTGALEPATVITERTNSPAGFRLSLASSTGTLQGYAVDWAGAAVRHRG